MNNDFNDPINEYLPLRDVVFQTLRRSILMGELAPGERLMEVKLADRLGVSRTPIREAIHKLELEGLVVLSPRKGASVAKITEKDLNDVLEVRCSLEELAVELACRRISAEQICLLKETMEKFCSAINKDDLTAIAEQDVAFHDVIFAATDNNRLIQLLNNLREQMYRYRVEYLKDSESHTRLIDEHNEIIEDIENGNIEEARKNIKAHIYNQAMAVSKTLKK